MQNDAAFAIVYQDGDDVIRLLQHHSDDVDKGTENSTVDREMLINAIGELKTTQEDQELVEKARTHLFAHAVALGIDICDSDVSACEAQSTDQATLLERIEQADGLDEVEELIIEANEHADEDAMSAAIEKADAIKKDGKQPLCDIYECVIEEKQKQENGEITFKARVAQANKINKNRRYYPKEEFVKNIPRVNRLIKAGRLWGMDGHPDFLSSPKPSEICVRYDAFSIVDDNVFLEGAIIPTRTGQDIITLWDHGVKTEWSIIGYGDAKEEEDKKGMPYYVITDYVFDGCDIVTRGAANTATIKWSKEEQENNEHASITILEAEEDAAMGNMEGIEREKDTNMNTPAVPDAGTEQKDAPASDVAENTHANDTPSDTEKSIADIASKVDGLVNAQRKALNPEDIAGVVAEAMLKQELARYKHDIVAEKAAGDEDIANIINMHIKDCASIEEVNATLEKAMPLVSRLKKQDEPAGFGVITSKHDQVKKFFRLADGKVVDRPKTPDGVMKALLEGIEDNGRKDNGNPRYVFEKMLKNYAVAEPKYLEACTEDGYRRWADATTTTTTALGTQQPLVLPLLRQIFPKLLPLEFASIQTLSQPTGIVYYLDFQYASGDNSGSSLDDSAAFDSTFADHTEGEAKSQIGFEMTSQSLEAVEKSIMYSVTSNLIQDMQATQGLDVEQILMETAADQIAREINMGFISMVEASITETATYGTVKPSTWTDQSDWIAQGLRLYLDKLSSKVASKTGQPCNILICNTNMEQYFSGINSYGLTSNPIGQTEFGMGIKKTMSGFLGKYDVYTHSWTTDNKIILAYRPPTWSHAGAVFAPYIPLYVGPRDYNAETNVAERSISSRYAQKVLKADAFASLTVAPGSTSDDPWSS